VEITIIPGPEALDCTQRHLGGYHPEILSPKISVQSTNFERGWFHFPQKIRLGRFLESLINRQNRQRPNGIRTDIYSNEGTVFSEGYPEN